MGQCESYNIEGTSADRVRVQQRVKRRGIWDASATCGEEVSTREIETLNNYPKYDEKSESE